MIKLGLMFQNKSWVSQHFDENVYREVAAI